MKRLRVVLTCDFCGIKDDFEWKGGGVERSIDHMQEAGWRFDVNKKGEDACPKCVHKLTADPVAGTMLGWSRS